MRHATSTLLPLIVGVLSFAALLSAQRLCGDPILEEHILPTQSVQATIHGTSFKFIPVKSNGELFPSAAITTRLESITQMNHPLNGDSDTPVKILNLNDCYCNYTSSPNSKVGDSLSSTSSPRLNPADVTRTELLVFLTCPGEFASTVLNLTFSTSSTGYDLTYTKTENTQGVPLVYTYPSQQLKLNLDLVNWPWNTNYTSTYLRLDFMGDMSMESKFRLRAEEDGFGSNFTISTENATLTAFFDKGVIIDGMPYRDDVRQVILTDFTTTSANVEGWPFPVDFKYRNLSNAAPDPSQALSTGFFTQLSYDPTFIANFTGYVPTPASSHKKAKVIAAATIGTICALIIIVLVMAILSTNVPACKDKLRPFHKKAKRIEPQRVSEVPEEDRILKKEQKRKRHFWSKHPGKTPPSGTPSKGSDESTA